MDDTQISTIKANQLKQRDLDNSYQSTVISSKKSHPIINDAQVIDANVLEGEDINPSIFEEPHHDAVNVDDYGRTMDKDEAERIKDRLNESFTEQFGTAAYSSALKKSSTCAPLQAANAVGSVCSAPECATSTAVVAVSANATISTQGSIARAGALVPVVHGKAATIARSRTKGDKATGSLEESEARKAKLKELFEGVDVDNLAKGLDVLKQVKDLNEQRRQDGDSKDEELDDDYLDSFADFEDGFDEGDNSLQGMHFVAQDENDNLDDELDFEDSSQVAKSKEHSSSTAVARSAGNIGAFIRAANMVPMLTEDEERTLAKRLREFGDVDAARRLVTSHLRFVVSVARKFTGYGLPLADLIQEGNIGLMKAVKNYDPDVGHGLAAFASSWIKAEMFDYVIRNWRMVKVATTKAQRKLFFNLRKSKKRLGWMSEQERMELAHDLGVSESDVAEMESRLAGSDVGFDLDESDSSDKSVAVTLSPASYLEDENSNFAQNYENTNYAAWEVKKLREALDSLDTRSRHIIKRRWLDENKATLQELSKEIGVSIERVRQLENNAMNKVKAILLNEGLKGEDGVLALEHHSSEGTKSKANLPATRVKASNTKRASGKGASARLKALPLKRAHKVDHESELEKAKTPAKRGRKKGSTKEALAKAKAAKAQAQINALPLKKDSTTESLAGSGELAES